MADTSMMSMGMGMSGAMLSGSIPLLAGTWLSQVLPIEDQTTRMIVGFQMGHMLGYLSHTLVNCVRVPWWMKKWWCVPSKIRSPFRVLVADLTPMFDKIEQHVLNLHLANLLRCTLRARSGGVELSLNNAQFTLPVIENWTDPHTGINHQIGLRILGRPTSDEEISDLLGSSSRSSAIDPNEPELWRVEREERRQLKQLQQLIRQQEGSPSQIDTSNTCRTPIQGSNGQNGNSAPSSNGQSKEMWQAREGDIVISSLTANCAVLRDYITHVYRTRESSELRVMTLFTIRIVEDQTSAQSKRRKKSGNGGHGDDDEDSHASQGSNQKKKEVTRNVSWEKIKVMTNRCLDNTMTSETVEQELLADAQWFMENPEWFNRRGVPYKRGYLLFGPPGTGKTSLVKALAVHYRLKVFVVDLNQLDSNQELLHLTTQINYLLADEERYIVLFEDIDRCPMFSELAELVRQEQEEESNNWQRRDLAARKRKLASMEPTMDCLLNILDGIIETQGRLLFFSANDTQPLKAVPNGALLRPGRIDRQVFVSFCTDLQMRRILELFYDDPDAKSRIATLPPLKAEARLTAALLTLVCQKYAEDLSAALEHLSCLYCESSLSSSSSSEGKEAMAAAMELDAKLNGQASEAASHSLSALGPRKTVRQLKNLSRQGEDRFDKKEIKLRRSLRNLNRLKKQMINIEKSLSKRANSSSIHLLERDELQLRLRLLEEATKNRKLSSSKKSSSSSSFKRKKTSPKKTQTVTSTSSSSSSDREPQRTVHQSSSLCSRSLVISVTHPYHLRSVMKNSHAQ